MKLLSLNLSPWRRPAPAQLNPIHKRLGVAHDLMEKLDLQRAYRGDPKYGKAMEERIVWRELLDLELQEADQRILEISEEAGRQMES